MTNSTVWSSSHMDQSLVTLIVVLAFICSCGKLLKSENEAQLHATRSGHANFSESIEEIKPLTEEEKKAQLEK